MKRQHLSLSTIILVNKGFQPINLALNMDMKAIWNVIGLGGAAKRDEYPCDYCAIKSDDLWLPGGTVCTTWCVGVVFENNKRELETSGKLWSCYHQEFLDSETLERMLEQVAEYKNALGAVADNMDDYW
jgi:hypothetical protein